MKMSEIARHKKALVVTTVASTLDQFCMNDINLLQKKHKVYVAANFMLGNNTSKERVVEFQSELQRKEIVVKNISFNRSPIRLNNLKAYQEIKKLIEENSFDIIHCHTPVAAMLVRLAAHKIKGKVHKVIYTAHGFHFYKGAPIKNWLLYYPVELILSKYTDVLITINKEDYVRAGKSFAAKKVTYIPGVGIDNKKFKQITVNKNTKYRELDLPENAFVILSVGELNKNKNHEAIIKAISKSSNSEIYYVICGQGVLEGYLKNLITNSGLERQVKLLGYRTDIKEIYKVVDVFVFPSFREGLSVALMEAMASGLPVICSDIRGNSDLIVEGQGGYLVNANNIDRFSNTIEELYNSFEKRVSFGKYNLRKIESYSVAIVEEKMKNIYKL